MSVKIRFDSQHNAEQPTIVLATKNGRLLGKLPCNNMQFKDTMNSYSELRFDVYKKDLVKDVNDKRWEQIKDFKLVWAREWNILFEIYVELDETDEIIKNISAKSLGEAELSQIKLHNIEINTETDIEREDYEPTVLFDENFKKISLLNRILEKAPHYKIKYVDSRIANIQRTFEFNNISIYDAFQQISEEINCLFVIKCYLDENWKVVREIHVFDLESYCLNCNTRGEFSTSCSECGSKNVLPGYGADTSICISTENLADNINYSTDDSSVKNCFKLEAGDDLMTATLVNCNPNGSGYIWHISDVIKEDMSDELVKVLNEYDETYSYYYKEHKIQIDSEMLNKYNSLIEKYQVFTHDYKKVTSPIVGYPSLMQEYYNTIDFYLYLNNSLMPSVEISKTSAELQAKKINTDNISPVAVQNIETCSTATATSAVLAMAKTIVDSRYQVKVKESFFDGLTWAGSFIVTNYSDEEDTFVTENIYVDISGDYEEFVKQKLEKVLSNNNDETTDVVSLFKLDESKFKDELKKYSLVRLTSFNDCCQSCLDLLIEQGIADNESWANKEPDLYKELYLPYYNKLSWIQEEIIVREEEISLIIGIYDNDGVLSSKGLQTLLDDERYKIQDILDFEKYIGTELWLEFVSYRREDTYQNNNYISDGLNNAELFQNALEFIEVAKKEIYKSATLQHSISATLKNLLVMKEFKPIVEHFEIGNWLRCKVDGKLNILRLISYEINFNNIDNLSVTFSDVKKVKDGTSDVESILNQASSMATSYSYVQRQANQGDKAQDTIKKWIANGLNSAIVQIKSNDNEEVTMTKNGLLCRSYHDITGEYLPEQLKITHNIIAYTDDDWRTVKQAIGKHSYVSYSKDENKFINKTGYGMTANFVTAGVVSGSQIIGGDIYSDNYSKTRKTGTYIDLTDGTFSFGGGSLIYDGKELRISSPDIVTFEQVTKITKDTIDVPYLNSLKITAGAVAAENITGTTISGKTISGGSLISGNITDDYYTKIKDGKITTTGIIFRNGDGKTLAFGGLGNYENDSATFTIFSKSHDTNIEELATLDFSVGLKIGSFNSYANNFNFYGYGNESLHEKTTIFVHGSLQATNFYGVYNEPSSDRNTKNTIEIFNDSYDKFFDELKPCHFKYNNDSSGNIHFGFIAQDIEDSMIHNNIPNSACLTKLKNKINDGYYTISKPEFVALNTWQIQKLKLRVREIENKINSLIKEGANI